MTWRLEFVAEPIGAKAELTAWRRGIATAAQEALLVRGLMQPDRPLRIEAFFHLKRPRSAKATARPVTRPSCEQLARIVNASLSGIVYPSKRDGLAVEWSIVKGYTDGPAFVAIEISEVVCS